jgi:hypothetical protein
MNAWDALSIGLGIAAGILAIVVGGRNPTKVSEKPSKPTLLGWSVLAFGLTTVILAALAMWGAGGSEQVPRIFGGGAATLIAGIGAIVKHDRHWPTWAGLGIGVLSAGIWVLFVAVFLLGARG